MLKFRVRKEVKTGILSVIFYYIIWQFLLRNNSSCFFLLFQGDSDVNNNPFVLNGNNQFDKNIQVWIQILKNILLNI